MSPSENSKRLGSIDNVLQQTENGLVFNFKRGAWLQANQGVKGTTFVFHKVVKANPCVYCGRKADGRDHILPKSKGGRDGWPNRAAACTKCDKAKADTSLLLFLVEQRCHAMTTGTAQATLKSMRLSPFVSK